MGDDQKGKQRLGEGVDWGFVFEMREAYACLQAEEKVSWRGAAGVTVRLWLKPPASGRASLLF